jgi:hypothetical protein
VSCEQLIQTNSHRPEVNGSVIYSESDERERERKNKKVRVSTLYMTKRQESASDKAAFILLTCHALTW